MRVLITGAAGFLGQSLLNELAVQHLDWTLIAADARCLSSQGLRPNIEPLQLDVSQPARVRHCVEQWRPDAIVHLAAVINPPREMSEAQLHAAEVGGTKALLDAARECDVKQLIVTSSGAAYGYHPDNAEWIDENQPLRGHPRFLYARHKQEIEQLLADARKRYPQLKQLILRPGTILGRRVHNPLTELFGRRSVLGIAGYPGRFVFIWDQDVVNVIRQGLERGSEGIYNLAGDGALSMREIAGLLGKPYRPLPATLVRAGLSLLKPLGLVPYGPEQVDFLRYRPALDNRRLKEEFGYQPRYSSREAFLAYLDARGMKE
ncbi:SDR family oxidoreductase [Pseudomonas sp. ZM23]|uniref:SDR family oxidoreductase n=1 Tax=Pseudomonas triclosanedens TaxID=2961893 RepID=A0ABY7A0C4_9PSED|nr:SDR family oxidoreductase [Pseudomonas triclosanedens]MCP8462459.1 SDR family oxidoreductase [Pseudomonas triclosanedens]MCP8468097.1 SDR family oxidoreductase [Pseudomonas triclosanedens]MCP8474856.1 SDR family oxidoreductase [Pseudomonas triclosanedens]WAI49653.1 SDR family oxidoreductase [Pseudomonas triclosanedens]